MDDELSQAIAMINAQVAQGYLTLANKTFSDVTYPTSVGVNTGFLPGGYAGGYGGGPTWGAMTGSAGLVGRIGSDERWAKLGYTPGEETLGGRGMSLQERIGAQQVGTSQSAQAQRDTELGMTYGGGAYVGGRQAPAWMQPHKAIAEEFARAHEGRAPTQAELQHTVVAGVVESLGALKADPVYQAADPTRRVQLEAQAVAQASGVPVANAAHLVQDLRAQTAATGGRMSSEQEVFDAVGRWVAPTDPAMAVNQAMTALRTDPSYQALDGAGRRAREAEAVAQAAGISPAQASGVVDELRQQTGAGGQLSPNEMIGRAISRVQGAPPQGIPQGGVPQRAPMYGQQEQAGGLEQGGQEMMRYGRQPGGMPSFGRQQTGGGVRSVGGGMNYAGSGLAGGDYANTAMSPAQRTLVEQGRQYDIGAQGIQRTQDITLRGQDITQQQNQGDLALRALQQESQLRADPFQLARYRYGMGQAGMPGVIGAVAGTGVMPTVQGGYGQAPQRPTMQNQLGQVGVPGFGRPGVGAGGQMAGLEQQIQAAGPLSQINARNYARLGQGGQQYANSMYRYAGEAGDDQDVQEMVKRQLPQFARRSVPTFGRLG